MGDHTRVLFLLLCMVFISCRSDANMCDELNEDFSFWTFRNYLSSTVRVVSAQKNTRDDTPDCLCRRTPCSSTEYALFGENNETEYLSDVTVILESGVHHLNNGILLDSVSRIFFVGVEGAVLQCGTSEHSISTNNTTCTLPNISIRNSTSIYFYGIIFDDCGLNQFANVFVQYSSNIVFHNCTFRNSLSSAVHLLNATSVAFLSCLFDSNVQESNEGTSAAQLENCHADRNSVFFLDSRPTAGGISVYTNKEPLKLLISDTRFVNNSARPNEDKTAARTVLSFGHGGGIFVRFVDTSDSQVCIINSEFTENSAEVNGGAIQLSAADYSSNNSVLIENCIFTKNKCLLDTCTGGAIGIDHFEESHDNLVHVINSSFYNNSAATGGAVALLTSVGTTPSEIEGKPLWFKDCWFEHNLARQDGSVFSFYSVTLTNELGFPVFVENCELRDNIALDVNKLTAAMSVFRVTVTFQQKTVFHNNFGGGLTLTESRANINGSVAFHHNFAYNGGGIAMYGRCLVEMYSGSELTFHNNFALKRGGGMYVEYVSADFIFSILNRGCFIQYFSEIDTPPNKWESRIHFANNTVGESGAAIYASDMSRCLWYGSDYPNNENQPIFVPVEGYDSPFMFRDNIVANDDLTNIAEVALATDAVRLIVTPQFEAGSTNYSYSEKVSFYMSTYDQFKNVREALWQVAALGREVLGALSVNNSLYQYEVPEVDLITNYTNDVNKSDISLYFTVNNVAAEVETINFELPISECHPGYTFDGEACICDSNLREIVRCDNQHRYFYVQEGLWVGSYSGGSKLLFQPAIPGFLNCDSEGNLPGCLYKYDDEDAQCAEGREGVLCSKCKNGYGLSFDLLSCHSDCSSWGGILAFLVFCIVVVILSFLALYFDIRISNKLKSLIFFGQVIKVIFRNSSYLSSDNSPRGRLLNFFVNLPGTSLPFPICFHSDVSGYAIAWLGIVPPTLALGTALIYVKLAERSNILQKGRKSKSYGLHGLHLIILFIYKYFLDAAFTFIDVRYVNGQDIFSYGGESGSSVIAVLTFVVGIILVALFAVVAPVLSLIYIYRPIQGHRHFADALTRGLKEDKKYFWYSVWDIWRRLPFIALNLLITATSVSIIVFCQLLLALFVLSVHCIVKPYIRNFINIVEAFILFCLFGATLAILDVNDIYIQRQIAITFILLPFAYGLLYAVYLSIKLSVRKFLKKELDIGKYLKQLQSAVKENVLSLNSTNNESSSQTQQPDYRDDHGGGTFDEYQTNKSKASSNEGESDRWNVSLPVQTREPLLDEDYIVIKQK